MAERFKSGALLGHIHVLEDGLAVRLRLARGSDTTAIRELLSRHGTAAPDLDLARLVHFDPRRRYVLCATGLIEGTEKLLAVGSIALDESAEPDLLVVAEGQSSELPRVMRRALLSAAASVSRSRAA